MTVLFQNYLKGLVIDFVVLIEILVVPSSNQVSHREYRREMAASYCCVSYCLWDPGSVYSQLSPNAFSRSGEVRNFSFISPQNRNRGKNARKIPIFPWNVVENLPVLLPFLLYPYFSLILKASSAPSRVTSIPRLSQTQKQTSMSLASLFYKKRAGII